MVLPCVCHRRASRVAARSSQDLADWAWAIATAFRYAASIVSVGAPPPPTGPSSDGIGAIVTGSGQHLASRTISSHAASSRRGPDCVGEPSVVLNGGRQQELVVRAVNVGLQAEADVAGVVDVGPYLRRKRAPVHCRTVRAVAPLFPARRLRSI